jgi:hypothetical protein
VSPLLFFRSKAVIMKIEHLDVGHIVGIPQQSY